jgi:DNA-binding transcriptional regulator YdaS (Cro superfamily)
MTAEQFRKLALKLFGPEHGWQSRCAEALGVDRASVSRWISGAVAEVPGPVAAAMECWKENGAPL